MPTSSRRAERNDGQAQRDFGDQLDLDAGAQRDLRHAERAARMRALVAEHLGQQLGAAVGHQMLLGEVGRAVDQAHHLDDALDLVQVAHRGVQRAHQVDRHRARGGLAFFGVDVAAELADPGLAVALGDVAGEKTRLPVRTKGT